MKPNSTCTGILFCAALSVTTVWSYRAAAESVSEPTTTVAAETTAPVITAQAPPAAIVTSETPPAPIVTTEAPPAPIVTAQAPAAQLVTAPTSDGIQLAGYVKHHHNPFLAALKKEFDSPIHTITTNNRNF
jgi:hypothetical protein